MGVGLLQSSLFKMIITVILRVYCRLCNLCRLCLLAVPRADSNALANKRTAQHEKLVQHGIDADAVCL